MSSTLPTSLQPIDSRTFSLRETLVGQKRRFASDRYPEGCTLRTNKLNQWNAMPTVEQWRAKLESDDATVRRRAAKALSERSDTPWDLLVMAALYECQGSGRFRGSDDSVAEALLKEALDNSSSLIQMRATYLLAEMSTGSAKDLACDRLSVLLRRDDLPGAIDALRRLMGIGTPRAIDILRARHSELKQAKVRGDLDERMLRLFDKNAPLMNGPCNELFL